MFKPMTATSTLIVLIKLDLMIVNVSQVLEVMEKHVTVSAQTIGGLQLATKISFTPKFRKNLFDHAISLSIHVNNHDSITRLADSLNNQAKRQYNSPLLFSDLVLVTQPCLHYMPRPSFGVHFCSNNRLYWQRFRKSKLSR